MDGQTYLDGKSNLRPRSLLEGLGNASNRGAGHDSILEHMYRQYPCAPAAALCFFILPG